MPTRDSTQVTVEGRDTTLGRSISGRRSGELIACAVEHDDGTWDVIRSDADGVALPPLRARSEADALAWVSHLTNAAVPVESPVVAVAGLDLQFLLDRFQEVASRPYTVVRVWIDPIDRAVKVKAGSGTWSPPFGEIEVSV